MNILNFNRECYDGNRVYSFRGTVSFPNPPKEKMLIHPRGYSCGSGRSPFELFATTLPLKCDWEWNVFWLETIQYLIFIIKTICFCKTPKLEIESWDPKPPPTATSISHSSERKTVGRVRKAILHHLLNYSLKGPRDCRYTYGRKRRGFSGDMWKTSA